MRKFVLLSWCCKTPILIELSQSGQWLGIIEIVVQQYCIPHPCLQVLWVAPCCVVMDQSPCSLIFRVTLDSAPEASKIWIQCKTPGYLLSFCLTHTQTHTHRAWSLCCFSEIPWCSLNPTSELLKPNQLLLLLIIVIKFSCLPSRSLKQLDYLQHLLPSPIL